MTINKRAGWWMRKLCEKVFAATIFLHNHPNTWKECFKQSKHDSNYYCRGAPLESRIKNTGARPWNGRPSWMSEAIKKLSWTDDKQKSRAAERHRGMRSIRRRLCMRWPDVALSSSEAHICNRGSPLALPSLTWDENGVVLSLSQHPDRVSDEVMVQHRLLPLWVAYELMTTLVNYTNGLIWYFALVALLTCWVSGSMRSKKALTVARTSSLHLRHKHGADQWPATQHVWLHGEKVHRLNKVSYHTKKTKKKQKKRKKEKTEKKTIQKMFSYHTIDRWSVETHVLGTAVAYKKNKVASEYNCERNENTPTGVKF